MSSGRIGPPMPARSKAQQHLMAAAAHGASFPKAKAIRGAMTLGQIAEYAQTPTKKLPAHVKPKR